MVISIKLPGFVAARTPSGIARIIAKHKRQQG